MRQLCEFGILEQETQGQLSRSGLSLSDWRWMTSSPWVTWPIGGGGGGSYWSEGSHPWNLFKETIML